MSVIGSSANWSDLLDEMLPQLLRLTIDTWRSLRRPLDSDREDDITNTVCRALRDNRTIRELPFYIHTQLVELEPAAGQDLGRLDIAFLPTGLSGPPNESVYFCLECKRLNVVKNGQMRAYASEYVLHGMMRFVSGQYSQAVSHGGMLGYVLDGNVKAAVKNIGQNVHAHCVDLGMDPPGKIRPSSILASEPRARETVHRRAQEAEVFRIHHLFVSAVTAGAKGPPSRRRTRQEK